ncbi:MAG: hypothetical protein ABJB11_11455 [Ferruginibacter sp.]
MKKQLENLFIPINKTAMNILLTDVKETLASDFNVNKHKQFCTAELWNIQRSKKRVAIRKINV